MRGTGEKMKPRRATGINKREDFLKMFLECGESLQNDKLNINKRPANIKILIDFDSGLYVNIISVEKVRVGFSGFKRDFFAFDYDTAKEWVCAVYDFVSGLLDHTVMLHTIENKAGKPLVQKIIFVDGNTDEIYFKTLKTVNVLSVFLNRKNVKQSVVSIRQRWRLNYDE